jgi:serralysin
VLAWSFQQEQGFVTSFAITGSSTVGRTLIGGESGLVGAQASLVVSGSDAVTTSGNTLMVVAGTILSNSNAIIDSGSIRLEIGTGASVMGGLAGLRFTTSYGDRYISNDGTISGYYGIAATGIAYGDGVGGIYRTQYSITNSGSILGSVSWGIRLMLNSGDTSVVNSGTIAGHLAGLSIQSGPQASLVSIVNSGTIDGADIGIQCTESGTLIRNTGTIIGADTALDFNGGGGRVFNSGTISGAVQFSGDNDLFKGRNGTTDDVVSGASGHDTLIGGKGGFEAYGGGGNDLLRGTDGPNSLFGDGGKDVLIGAAGDDSLDGGGGFDTVRGGGGSDELLGRGGGDVISGGDGNDRITGGSGRDLLAGGEGADDFVYLAASDSPLGTDNDVIRDFRRGRTTST